MPRPVITITLVILCSGITLFLGGLFLTGAGPYTQAAAAAPAPSIEVAPTSSETIATETYVDDAFGLSFNYPADLEIEVFDDPAGDHVIFGNRPTGDLALVVNVSPLDEPLTADLIYANVDPSELTAPVKEFALPPSGVPA